MIDWTLPAADIDRRVRTFNPFPGASTVLTGSRSSSGVPTDRRPGGAGRVLAVDRQGVLIACGEGALRVLELQKAGGKRLPVAQFVAGNPLATGAVFGSRRRVGVTSRRFAARPLQPRPPRQCFT